MNYPDERERSLNYPDEEQCTDYRDNVVGAHCTEYSDEGVRCSEKPLAVC